MENYLQIDINSPLPGSSSFRRIQLPTRVTDMLKFTFLTTTLWAFVSATPLDRRAGAPIPQPIPANCTIVDPVLCISAEYCDPISSEPYRPTNATLTPALDGPFLYGYYLQPDSFQVTSGNASSLLETCLETCYGYGYIGSCLGVYQAYNYPAPPMFGGPGGNPTVACLLFNKALTTTDFELVPEDQRGNWTDPASGNIVCPASATKC